MVMTNLYIKDCTPQGLLRLFKKGSEHIVNKKASSIPTIRSLHKIS